MPATNSTVAVAVHVAALTASTVDTVTLTQGYSTVLITNRGATDIYFTLGLNSATAATPTVAGNDCYICQASTAKQINFVGDVTVPTVTSAKLISSGTSAYSVEIF